MSTSCARLFRLAEAPLSKVRCGLSTDYMSKQLETNSTLKTVSQLVLIHLLNSIREAFWMHNDQWRGISTFKFTVGRRPHWLFHITKTFLSSSICLAPDSFTTLLAPWINKSPLARCPEAAVCNASASFPSKVDLRILSSHLGKETQSTPCLHHNLTNAEISISHILVIRNLVEAARARIEWKMTLTSACWESLPPWPTSSPRASRASDSCLQREVELLLTSSVTQCVTTSRKA